MLGTCRDGGTIYKSHGSGRPPTQPKYDIMIGCTAISEIRSCSQKELVQGVCGESMCDSRPLEDEFLEVHQRLRRVLPIWNIEFLGA